MEFFYLLLQAFLSEQSFFFFIFIIQTSNLHIQFQTWLLLNFFNTLLPIKNKLMDDLIILSLLRRKPLTFDQVIFEVFF